MSNISKNLFYTEKFRNYSLRVLSTTKDTHKDLISSWNGSMRKIQKVGIEIEQKLGLPLFHVPLNVEEPPTNGNWGLISTFNRISEFSETVHMLTLKRISDKLGTKYIKPTLQLLKQGHLKALVELDFLTGEFDEPQED